MKEKSQHNCSNRSKKIRKGDTVKVLRGDSRGRVGVVLSCKDDAVIVQGVNMQKRHRKATQENQKGTIVELEKAIHVSNVAVCVDDKPVKLRTRTNNQGNRELYYHDGDKVVTYRSLKNNK